jgi:hypothetical protein
VQATVEVRELPPADERIHDDRVRVGGPRRRHDRLVRTVELEPMRRCGLGEDREQRYPRVRCLRAYLRDGPLDLPPLDGGGHAAVVVAGLHDHQRGVKTAKPLGLDHARDGTQARIAGRDVTDAGDTVDDGVPVQRPGQHGGPGEGGDAGAHPGRVRGADDRHRGHRVRPALDASLARAERVPYRKHASQYFPRFRSG